MSKKAMITGASSGIGLAFAERLAREGWSLTLVARNGEKLQEHEQRLPGQHRVLAADLSAAVDLARVSDDVRAGSYDLLINNAGVGAYGRFEAVSVDKQLAMMRLNMDAVVTLAHAFLKTAKGGDAVINVASTLGLLAFPGATTYSATKAFVTSLSEGLWWENRDKNVYVAGLLPGVTRTSFHEAAGGDDTNRPPDNMSQSAEQVVDVAMDALAERSSPTIICGFSNRAMVFATRFMPRKSMVNLMGGFGSSAPPTA